MSDGRVGPESLTSEDFVVAAKLERGPDGSLIGDADRYTRLNKGEARPNERDMRTETEKDRGRIQYSSFLRRLAGVTQVVSPSLSSSRLHTRESHSQKVALVAREIAEDITRRASTSEAAAIAIAHNGGLDVTACEAAGLAHDLGHPPFGHAGEVALNRALRDKGVIDGFEGNAQSFRIVTRLDRRKVDNPKAALDLTAVTLAAILKYPFLCSVDDPTDRDAVAESLKAPPKFGAYESDREAFDGVWKIIRPTAEMKGRQTLEASVMDLADDITYAIHDLEDFYREGVIDFVDVSNDLEEAIRHLTTHSITDLPTPNSNAFLKYGEVLNKKFPGYFNKDLYADKLGQTAILITKAELRIKFTGSWAQITLANYQLASLIEAMFKSIDIKLQPEWQDGPSVFLKKPEWHLMQCLKTVTRRYVVSTASMGTMERSQKRIVEKLFSNLCSWLETQPLYSELPQPLSDYLRDLDETGERVPAELDQPHFRALADYICSLSDQECYMRSKWLEGEDYPAFSSLH